MTNILLVGGMPAAVTTSINNILNPLKDSLTRTINIETTLDALFNNQPGLDLLIVNPTVAGYQASSLAFTAETNPLLAVLFVAPPNEDIEGLKNYAKRLPNLDVFVIEPEDDPSKLCELVSSLATDARRSNFMRRDFRTLIIEENNKTVENLIGHLESICNENNKKFDRIVLPSPETASQVVRTYNPDVVFIGPLSSAKFGECSNNHINEILTEYGTPVIVMGQEERDKNGDTGAYAPILMSYPFTKEILQNKLALALGYSFEPSFYLPREGTTKIGVVIGAPSGSGKDTLIINAQKFLESCGVLSGRIEKTKYKDGYSSRLDSEGYPTRQFYDFAKDSQQKNATVVYLHSVGRAGYITTKEQFEHARNQGHITFVTTALAGLDPYVNEALKESVHSVTIRVLANLDDIMERLRSKNDRPDYEKKQRIDSAKNELDYWMHEGQGAISELSLRDYVLVTSLENKNKAKDIGFLSARSETRTTQLVESILRRELFLIKNGLDGISQEENESMFVKSVYERITGIPYERAIEGGEEVSLARLGERFIRYFITAHKMALKELESVFPLVIAARAKEGLYGRETVFFNDPGSEDKRSLITKILRAFTGYYSESFKPDEASIESPTGLFSYKLPGSKDSKPMYGLACFYFSVDPLFLDKQSRNPYALNLVFSVPAQNKKIEIIPLSSKEILKRLKAPNSPFSQYAINTTPETLGLKQYTA